VDLIPVTDPSLLKRLEEPEEIYTPDDGLEEVTDPNVLKMLETDGPLPIAEPKRPPRFSPSSATKEELDANTQAIADSIGIDNSSAWGDLVSSWHSLQSAMQGRKLPGLNQAQADVEAITPQNEVQRQYFEQRKASLKEQEASAITGMAKSRAKAQAVPEAPSAQKFNQSKGFTESWDNFWADPITITRSTTLRSGATSMPSIVGGIVGMILGPVGAAAGAGAGSAMVEYGSVIADELVSHGADLNDAESVKAVWEQHGEEITAAATKRASIIGVFDAASGGLGGKIAAGPMTPVKKILLGTGTQMAGGAGGEATAQVAESGEITSWPGVLGEVIGEAGGGAIETGGQMLAGSKSKPQPEPVPQPVPQPAPGSIPGEAQTPAPATTLTLEQQLSILEQQGYTNEQMAEMDPAERAAEAEAGRQAGIEPYEGLPSGDTETALETPEAPAPVTPPLPEEPPQAPLPESAPIDVQEERGTRNKPQKVEAAQDLDEVRRRVDTEPTEKEQQAGNYQKGHVKLHGFDISIENPKGSIRRGKDADGTPYESQLPADYGYIKKVPTRSRDGDHVDVFVGDAPESPKIFVIDQVRPGGKRLDEPKVIFGVNEEVEAVHLYNQSFSDGQGVDRIAAITETTPELLKQWLEKGSTSFRFARQKRFHAPLPASKEQITLADLIAESQPVGVNDAGQPLYENRRGRFRVRSDRKDQPDGYADFGGDLAPVDIKVNKPPKAKPPQSFISWVIAQGGVRDDTGELRAMDLHRRPGLIRKTGKSIDELREGAIESGFLTDVGRDYGGEAQTTKEDVYALFAKEAGGDKHYSLRDSAAAAAQEAKTQASLAQEAPPEFEALGPQLWSFFQSLPEISPDDYTPDILAKAKAILEVDPSIDAASALEAAVMTIEEGLIATQVHPSDLPFFPDAPTIEDTDESAGPLSEAEPSVPEGSSEGAPSEVQTDRQEAGEELPGSRPDEPRTEQVAEAVSEGPLEPEKPSTGKGARDRVGVDAHFLSDVTQTPSFRKHGFSSLDVPTQREVLHRVFLLAQNPEVLRSIVETIPVDVVNVLSGGKLSAKQLFHNEAVLTDLFAVNGKHPVSLGTDAASATVLEVARSVAKNLRSEVARIPSDASAASQTRKSDHPYTVEQTDQGIQQVIPGAEKISEAETAQRQADKPLKAKAPQKDADEGLFGDEKDQTDLIDRLRQKDVLTAAPAEKPPVFYSGLIRAVEGMKQPKAPAAQWMNTIRNAPGVKQEELDWLGLPDWLGKQSGPITKEALLNFLKANQISVNEVVKGGASDLTFKHGAWMPIGEGEKSTYAYLKGEEHRYKLKKPEPLTELPKEYHLIHDANGPNGREWGIIPEGQKHARSLNDAMHYTEEEAVSYAINFLNSQKGFDLYAPSGEKIEMFWSDPDDPRIEAAIRKHLDIDNKYKHGGTEFETYTLPGGENYRELLLTLPERHDVVYTRDNIILNEAESTGDLWRFEAPDNGFLISKKKYANADDARDYIVREKKPNPKESFTASHWREPNVLLHVRFNERTDSDGRKVLFVEEIQSDWHQRARRQGYKKEITKERAEELGYSVYQARSNLGSDAYFLSGPDNIRNIPNQGSDTEAEAWDRLLSFIKQHDNSVPDAPFKTTWPELAMKRMVRWAAENGFDRIAWTPGEIQADRYNLAKHLDKLKVVEINPDQYHIEGFKKNERLVENYSKRDELPSVIGKDLADKALEKIEEGKKRPVPYYAAVFEGQEMTIGGEGMRAFYDKMLVDVANKLGKKFGAKVGRTDLTYPTRFNISRETGYSVPADHKTERVPSLDITPAMREAAMAGQPLFRRDDPKTGNLYQFVITDKQREHLKSRVHVIAKRIMGRTLPIIEFEDTLPGFDGVFEPHEWLIWIALRSQSDPRLVIRHEAVHVLKRVGLFTDGEWRMLSRLAERKWMSEYQIAKRYEHYAERTNYDELLIEEAIAEAYLHYAALGPQKNAADRIFEKLKRLLEAIRNMLRGEGFTSVNDIFDKIERGQVAKRAEKKAKVAKPIGQEVLTMAQPPDGNWSTGHATDPTVGPDPKDFQSNINLDKIAAPEDVKTVITTVGERAQQFITERRGVVSNEQTKELAKELGMNAAELAKRTTGQAFNAHEIYAARVLMVQSASTVRNLAAKASQTKTLHDLAQFQKAFTRHVAIQEQIAGMTAEAGRALQQFRMMAGANYLPIAKAMADEAKAKDKKAPFGAKTKTGTDAIIHLADMINALDDPSQLNRFTRDAFKVTLWDKIREIWINALLSGPRTHATNILSNFITALWQVPETSVAAVIGSLHGGDKVRAREATARLIGVIEGAKEGLSKATTAFITGEPTDAMSKVEQHRRKAVGGTVGEIVRIPSRALLAEDEFFKTLNRLAEINARAVRLALNEGLRGQALSQRIAEIKANPPPSLKKAADEWALYQTFQNHMGPIGTMVMRLRDSVPGLYLLMPFIRTPANLIKYAAERTPFGLMMGSVRENLAGTHGNIARDMQIARMGLGSSVALVIGSWAMAGILTGSGPDDPDERRLWLENHQPYAIKFGDTWISYQRLDPFGLILGVTADLIGLGGAVMKADGEKVGSMIVGALSQNLLNKTWLSGLSDFIEAVQDPTRYGEGYVRRMAGTLIPNLSAQIAQTIDPVLRDARTTLDNIKTRVPGMGKSLPPRRNIFGEPIRREGSFGPDLLSPLYLKTDTEDPVVNAMLEIDYAPSMPSRRINGHELTPEQYSEYAEIAGKAARVKIEPQVRGKGWRSMPPDRKIDKIKRAFDESRDLARKRMKRKYPELAKSPK
jgi:hypothetical protein